MTTFWLYSDYILTTFWLHSGYILATFWLHSGFILATFRLHFGYIPATFRLHSGYILTTFCVHSGYTLATILMIIDLKRSIDLRWMYDPVLLFILRWSCFLLVRQVRRIRRRGTTACTSHDQVTVHLILLHSVQLSHTNKKTKRQIRQQQKGDD